MIKKDFENPDFLVMLYTEHANNNAVFPWASIQENTFVLNFKHLANPDDFCRIT